MKKFQIVRVDGDSVQKADLQIGDNIIGVGAVTGCKDERVPKHAITINVSPDGEMMINPVAPCYMKSPGSSGWVKLDEGSTTPIHVGDLFSLLSDKYWFKLISVDVNMEDDESGPKRKASENGIDEPLEKKLRQDGSIETLQSSNGNLENVSISLGIEPGQEELDPFDYEEAAASSTETTTNDIYGASLPEGGKPPDTTSSTKLQDSNSIDSTKSDEINESALSAIETTDKTVQENNSKTCTESADLEDPLASEEAGKKIKWDCGQHYSDLSDHAAANSSRVPDSEEPVETASNSNIDVPPVAPVSSTPIRNKCTYGSKCYRKNSEHRAQFSHPGDSDYEALDTRPECRFGIRCYRKNPQHKKDFKHTIQRRRRPQTPIRAKTPDTTSATDQSSYEESIDESEYEPSCFTDSSDEGKSDWDEK